MGSAQRDPFQHGFQIAFMQMKRVAQRSLSPQPCVEQIVALFDTRLIRLYLGYVSSRHARGVVVSLTLDKFTSLLSACAFVEERSADRHTLGLTRRLRRFDPRAPVLPTLCTRAFSHEGGRLSRSPDSRNNPAQCLVDCRTGPEAGPERHIGGYGWHQIP